MMKKSFLILISCIFAIGCINAQSSKVVTFNNKTTATDFKNACTFYKVNTVFYFSNAGLNIFGKVYEDLVSHDKIGALCFETETHSSVAANFKGDGGEDLGYLTMSSTTDLLKALETILTETQNKKDPFQYIEFSTDDGLEVFGNGKEFYFCNGKVYSEKISVKDLTKLIKAIGDAKAKIESCL